MTQKINISPYISNKYLHTGIGNLYFFFFNNNGMRQMKTVHIESVYFGIRCC